MLRGLAAFLLLLTSTVAGAATYSVTNVNDSGAGSLRQAVSNANANGGADTITFNIAGGGPHVIYLASDISVFGAVTIDGSTDPHGIVIDGASITLAGDGSTIDTLGFRCASCNGIVIVAGSGDRIVNSTFGPIDGSGISIRAGSDHVVEDNVFVSCTRGVHVVGSAAQPLIRRNSFGRAGEGNQTGVWVDGLPSPAIDENTFAFNGIGVSGSSKVTNNRIVDNEIGISAVTADMTITGNTIFSNIHGISLARTGNGTIINNDIAFNSGDGIHDDRSGGFYHAEENHIHDNGGNGVAVLLGGTMNLVHNAIDNNGLLGIDLQQGSGFSAGVTPNDAGDGDLGGNGLQNYPLLTSAVTNGSIANVTGSISSTPSSAFTIELYDAAGADPTGHGEGSQFLADILVTTDGAGNASFGVNVPGVPVGTMITATATGDDGTSEFAANITATPTTPPPPASLQIAKSISAETVFRGGALRFVVTVTNAASNPALDVVMTDALPAGMTASSIKPSQGSCGGSTSVVCAIGTLAPAQNVTIRIDTTAPMTDGPYTNTATARGSNAAEVTAQRPFTVEGGADVYALLDAPARSAPGSEITLHATVGNNGPDSAPSARITIRGGTIISTDASIACGPVDAATVRCSTIALPAGQTRAIDVRVQLGDEGTLFEAHAESAVGDPHPENNDATALVETGAADLDVALDATPQSVRAGQTFLLTANVVNRSAAPAGDVTLRFTLPPELTLVHAPNYCTGASEVVCAAGSLREGQVATARLEIRAPRTAGALAIVLDVGEEQVTERVLVIVPRQRAVRH
ncbi:MAG TPA: right-handed parallel beta-helix repeat-containing protein [Thermoanaerobaculia bacterium]|nr:right-handed parallel beta-helix repeat-containing protein [Thermoanaerobaculia bacterium]